MNRFLFALWVALLLPIPDARAAHLPGGDFTVHWDGADIQFPTSLWVYGMQKRTFLPALIEALIREGGFTEADKQPPDEWLRELGDPGLIFYKREIAHERWTPSKQLVISPRNGWIDYRDEEATPPKVPIEGVPEWDVVREKTKAWMALAGIRPDDLFHEKGSKEPVGRTNATMTTRYNPRTGETIGPVASERAVEYRRSPLDGMELTGAPIIRCSYANQGKLRRLEIVWKNYVRQMQITLPTTNQIADMIREGKAEMGLWNGPLPKPESVRVVSCSVYYIGLSGDAPQRTLHPNIHLTTEIVAGDKTNQCFLRLVPD